MNKLACLSVKHLDCAAYRVPDGEFGSILLIRSESDPPLKTIKIVEDILGKDNTAVRKLADTIYKKDRKF